MLPHRVAVRPSAILLVAAALLGISGCFLMSRTPGRPDPAQPVSGPAIAAERCQTCHAAPVAEEYAKSLHAAMGIRCGQCHAPGGHPNFTQPVRDATCAGCHQPQYQQTIASLHFVDRQPRALDGDRSARVALRAEVFVATTNEGRRFVGDSTSGDLGGRLCAACHYDEHRLGRDAVQRPDFCVKCHTGLERHFASAPPGPANRCTRCHVRAGATESGQTINTHLFARPGRGRAGP